MALAVKKIKILAVDDEQLVLNTLASYLQETPDLTLIHITSNPQYALDIIRQEHVDILLTDIEMPSITGPDLIYQALKPGNSFNPHIQCVAFTVHDQNSLLFDALKKGARGYILKSEDPAFIISSLRNIAQGDPIFSPKTSEHLINMIKPTITDFTMPNLNELETDVFKALCDGLSNAEIAQALYISESTVKKKVSILCEKFGVASRLKLVVKAYNLGLHHTL